MVFKKILGQLIQSQPTQPECKNQAREAGATVQAYCAALLRSARTDRVARRIARARNVDSELERLDQKYLSRQLHVTALALAHARAETANLRYALDRMEEEYLRLSEHIGQAALH